MSGKGSNRRPTDEAAFSEGFDRIFRSKTKASSSNGKAPGSTPEDLCSNQSEAATFTFFEDPWHRKMEAAIEADPSLLDEVRAVFDGSVVYIDDATGKMVDEDYWP